MILCIGTTPTVQRTMVFDRLTLDAVNRAVEVRESASGKSINVARTLRRLGADALASGFLGGESGKAIRRDLDDAGINHDFVTVKPKTRTCVTVLDRSNSVATELVEETKPVDAMDYSALLGRVEEFVPKATVVVLSGSLTPNGPTDFYARCTAIARKANVPVIIDARGEPLKLALAERPAVVKPNRIELQETVGFEIRDEPSLRKAIADLLSRGPEWAIITDGPRDAIASDGKQFFRITPPKIKPVNPIGSGDAFAAGLALAIQRGNDLPEACRLAAACGAANALNSPPGHANPQDVARLLSEVKVATIE